MVTSGIRKGEKGNIETGEGNYLCESFLINLFVMLGLTCGMQDF